MGTRDVVLLIVAGVVLYALTSDARASTPDVSPSNPQDNNTRGARQNQAPEDLYLRLLDGFVSLGKEAITVGKQTSEGR